LDGEYLNLIQVASLGLILMGVYIVNRGRFDFFKKLPLK
jgi:multidrug transporter EmrE-like cation transporter